MSAIPKKEMRSPILAIVKKNGMTSASHTRRGESSRGRCNNWPCSSSFLRIGSAADRHAKSVGCDDHPVQETTEDSSDRRKTLILPERGVRTWQHAKRDSGHNVGSRRHADRDQKAANWKPEKNRKESANEPHGIVHPAAEASPASTARPAVIVHACAEPRQSRGRPPQLKCPYRNRLL